MAESAVKFLIQNLGPLLVNEVQLLKGVDGEVRELINEFESIESVLRDADARQDTDEGLKTWVKQIREVAYDVEDVLDEFMLSQAQEKQGCIDFLCILINQYMVRHKTASSIRDIRTRVHSIKERKDAYSQDSTGQTSSSKKESDQSHDPRPKAPFVEEADLVGIDEPRKKLIEQLVNEDSRLLTISVVGMGGLGKTTLVKKVYDDQQVKKYFETYAWITVSQSFEAAELLRSMIKQFFMAKEDPQGEGRSSIPQGLDAMTQDELTQMLRSYLQDKRYVLVLDDVWEADVWNDIGGAFPDNENGSRVIISTRNRDVTLSSCIGPSHLIYDLKPLPPTEAWSLFCKKAFHSHNENRCTPGLEKLSGSFVDKCRGLPLAIVTLGSLLSSKTNDEWEMIHRSLGSELERDDNLRRMMKILLLSFNDLPYYLKSCFLYLSIFPYPIKRIKIIRLWIAEGFVERKEGRSKEEVAEGYLNELISRNLVHVAEWKLYGKVSTCRIHDLVREMIIPKFKEEHFFSSSVEENTMPCNRIRRLSIYKDETFQKIDAFSCLRSLFIFGAEGLSNAPAITSFSGLRLLKVVDLENTSMEIFPDDLTSLLHLRYLSLQNTKIKKLPSSLGRLKNLETLNLKGTFVCELPVEILKLKCLCHLLVYRYSEFEFYTPYNIVNGIKVPAGMGSMRSLQKLAFIEAESGIIRELGNLTQLRRLGIIKLKVEDGNDLCTSIEKMNHLHAFSVTSMDEEEVLDLHSLSHPPLPLQRLHLRGRLEKLPEWIASLHNLVVVRLRWSRLRDDPLKALQSLPNLVELKLDRAYDGEELRCDGRGYPRLKKLELCELSGLKNVRVEKGAMSSLEGLDIRRCEELVEAPLWLEHVTNLKELYLYDMSVAFLKGLKKDGVEELVDSVRHITIIRCMDTHANTHWDLS